MIIIPIGTNCSPTFFLKQFDIRKKSHVFDWDFTLSLKTINLILNDEDRINNYKNVTDIYHKDLNKYPVKYNLRSPNNEPSNDMHQFGSLSSADDEAFDLNDIEFQIAHEKHKKDNNNKTKEEKKSIREYYRWVRGMGYDNNFNEYYEKLSSSGGNKRGLLLIYPVVTNQNDENPLIGVTISFPKTSNSGHAEYTISNYDYERMNELY